MSKRLLGSIIYVLTLFFSITLLADLRSNLKDIEHDLSDIYQAVSPYVVKINLNQKTEQKNIKLNANLLNFASIGRHGSGIIWGNEGLILTNYHVIKDAKIASVILPNGVAIAQANVVGVAPKEDIAILRVVDPQGLKYIKSLEPLVVANSSKLKVGQFALAIGNPHGLRNTMTLGIISAVGRIVPGSSGVSLHDMIQTDAAINPGSSGGPLFNTRGELIGMNTLIYSASGASAGIGFATPSNTIKFIINQINKFGYVKHAGLGIELLDSKDSNGDFRGAVISKVIPNSPAAKAGLRGIRHDKNGRLKIGDIILAINGKEATDYNGIIKIMQDLKVGSVVDVKYLRDGKVRNVKIQTCNRSQF